MSDSFAQRVTTSWLNSTNAANPQSNIFSSPRQEGELDLVSICRTMLVEAGLMQSVTAAFDQNQYIRDAISLGPEAQRFLLNKFWHLQLISLGCDTQKERFCLLDQGDYNEWIRCFREAVLPKVIEYKLPLVF